MVVHADRGRLVQERLAVLLLTLLGIGLRWERLDRIAIDHFDEGVYASKVWFGHADRFAYPNQHLYAPPLLPWLIEQLFLLAGPSDLLAVVPGLICGSATVPLAWWIGRRWFGPAAGMTAALLAATSGIHVAFSRTALTDVPLTMFLMLAVAASGEALQAASCLLAAPSVYRAPRQRAALGWSALAGLATALAWWTKYNGWLPLGIAGGAVLLRIRRAPFLQAAVWFVAAAVAFLAFLPVLHGLQPVGGYAAVVQNHRGYLVGLSGWWTSAARQAELLHEFSASMLLLLPILACSAAGLLTAAPVSWAAAAVFVFLAALVHSQEAAAVAAGLTTLIVRALVRPSDDVPRESRRTPAAPVAPAAALLTVWFVGLTFATPFYRPYPRLMLPWVAATWLIGGWSVQVLWNSRREPPGIVHRRRARVLWTAAGAGLAAAVWIGGSVRPRAAAAWEDRTGLRTTTRALLADVRPELPPGEALHPDGPPPMILDVYGEPAVLFQLRQTGWEWVRPVSHLRFAHRDAPAPRVPTYVVAGPHALRDPQFERALELAKRIEPVRDYPYESSRLSRLDDPPDDGNESPPRLRLFRVR